MAAVFSAYHHEKSESRPPDLGRLDKRENFQHCQRTADLKKLSDKRVAEKRQ